MKDAGFIAMNASDFLDFYVKNHLNNSDMYFINDKQRANVFFGTNNGYDQLNHLKD